MFESEGHGEQTDDQANRAGRIHRLFSSTALAGHELGTHGIGAAKIGAELIGAGYAAIVHAAVPGWFTETAGKTVTRIYDHIQARKAGSADPEN